MSTLKTLKLWWSLGLFFVVLSIGLYFGLWRKVADWGGIDHHNLFVFADLVPVAHRFDTSNGKSIQVVTVKNQGTGDVTVPFSTDVALYESAGGNPISCTAGAWMPTINALKAGASTDVQRDLADTGSTVSKMLSCGGVWRVKVDWNSLVKESDESNNTQFFPNK